MRAGFFILAGIVVCFIASFAIPYWMQARGRDGGLLAVPMRISPRGMSTSACASVFTANDDPCSTPDGGTVGAPGVGDAGPMCVITSYGAVPDAGTDQTTEIQAAIDACVGGTVVVPSGTYLSGTLTLHSNMVLYLGNAATLAGIIPTSVDAGVVEYPVPSPFPTPNNSVSPPVDRGFIYANQVTNLTIVGPGIINGNGGAFIWGKDSGVPDIDRPVEVWLNNSSNITINDTIVLNSALYTIVLAQDTGVLVENTSIYSPDPNERDGLDIVDSRKVCVHNVSVQSEDDSICLKSGSSMGVDHVHVVNSTAGGSKIPPGILSEGNGLKLGTVSYGGFSTVCFDNIDVSDYRQAAMAVESVDGAQIQNVLFTGISCDQVQAPFFVLFGDRYELPDGGEKKTGSVSFVTFRNITCSDVSSPWGSIITGTLTDAGTLTIGNVVFSNVSLRLLGAGSVNATQPPEYAGEYPDPGDFGQLPGWAFYTRHADSVLFVGVDASVAPVDSRLPYYFQRP